MRAAATCSSYNITAPLLGLHHLPPPTRAALYHHAHTLPFRRFGATCDHYFSRQWLFSAIPLATACTDAGLAMAFPLKPPVPLPSTRRRSYQNVGTRTLTAAGAPHSLKPPRSARCCRALTSLVRILSWAPVIGQLLSFCTHKPASSARIPRAAPPLVHGSSQRRAATCRLAPPATRICFPVANSCEEHGLRPRLVFAC
jgi:hypothetical protein